MTTQTRTLDEFLLARIAEDEAQARRHGGTPHVESLPGSPVVWWQKLAARVLAECEAKRRIVEEHAAVFNNPSRFEVGCQVCREEEWPCITLRLLALPYAEHPDYRKGWRP